MSVYVIDASVVIKWHVPEVHADAALRYLDADHDLHAPELLLPEVANILWKKARRREISEEDGLDILIDIRTPQLIRLHRMGRLAKWALMIAYETGCTAYDSMYLALAETLDGPLVTADRRLYEAARATRLARSVRWVEDPPV